MNEKYCNTCGEIKKTTEFYQSFVLKFQRYVYSSQCKDCLRADSRRRMNEKNNNNRDERRAYLKNYRKNNPDKVKGWNRSSAANNRNNLTNYYVKMIINKSQIVSKKFINDNPQIIETKRLQIKLKRKIKSIKDGKKQTN